MRKNTTRMFLLSWLVFIVACQNTSFAPVTPLTSITVEPPLAAFTPRVATTEYSLFTQIDLIHTGLSPKRGDAIVSLPDTPGDYLIYWTKRGLLQYVSLDGAIRGNLIDGYLINELDPTLEVEGLDPVRMISDGKDSRFIFAQEQDDKNYVFKSVSFWVTDIFGNSINSWRILPDPNRVCLKPIFSPQSRWVLIDCKVGRVDGELFYPVSRQLYIIKTESGAAQTVDITKCRGEEIFLPQQILWSRDEERFLYWCNNNEYTLMSTKGSDPTSVKIPAQGSDTATRNAHILSVSPDWEKIVFALDNTSQSVYGATPVNRIAVADLDCILHDPKCSEITTLDLPLAQPVDLTDNDYLKTQIYWIYPWDNLIWVVSSTETSSYGCIDLSTFINQNCKKNLSGQEYLGVSPDGQWLIFIGYIEQNAQRLASKKLYAVSVKDNAVRYLADPDVNNAVDYIRFYGWLTIR